MKKKVIITDHLHLYLQEQLVKMGFETDVNESISNEELLGVIHNYEGLVVSTRILVSQQLIDRGVKLQFIARAGSGMENIDVAYARSKQIHVINTPEANANAVAEHALGMLLSMMNNLSAADHELRNGIWRREENRGFELAGKTIGIIGYGHNGTAFAKILSGFDIAILVYDKYKSGFGGGMIRETSLEKIQAECDVISFHVPYTKETHHYFNEDFIRQCKKPVWLINTSRGKVVCTRDLIGALKSGAVMGAALDVFENENFYSLPEDDSRMMHELFKMKRVILTPHIAGWTYESFLRISKILSDKIAALQL